MSLDRYQRDLPCQFADNLARCKKSHFATYLGELRAPRLADEEGAELVLERMFGGRYLFIPDPQHADWYIVRGVPEFAGPGAWSGPSRAASQTESGRKQRSR